MGIMPTNSPMMQMKVQTLMEMVLVIMQMAILTETIFLIMMMLFL